MLEGLVWLATKLSQECTENIQGKSISYSIPTTLPQLCSKAAVLLNCHLLLRRQERQV